jgi:hypothetical protein
MPLGALTYLALLAFCGGWSYHHGRFDGKSLLLLVVSGALVLGLVVRAAHEDQR